MMVWRLLYCMLNRHRADKETITWNGTRHVATCPDCGKQVRKSSRGHHWKVLVPSEAGKSQ